MIAALLLAASFQAKTVEEVAERFANARKQPVMADATYKFELGLNSAQVRVLIDGTKRGLLKATVGEDFYTLSMTPAYGVVEIDSNLKHYDLQRYPGYAVPPISRLSRLSAAYPKWDWAKKIADLVPEGTKFVLDKPIAVNGFTADVLSAAYKNRVGSDVEFEVAIDGAGVIVQIGTWPKGNRNQPSERWTLLSYKPRTSIEDKEFETPLLVGYVPHATRVAVPKIEMEGPFPTEGWGADKQVSLKKLGGGKHLLLAILDAEEPSMRALASLEKIKQSIPVAIATTDKSLASKGYLVSEDMIRNTLDPPATPFFVLVSPDGKGVRYWMGYDPDESAEFEAQVTEAAAK